MPHKSLLALAIFGLVYAIILAGENSPRKLDRPAAGLIGAVLMVLTGVLTRSEALAAIDFGTLALLFGMMIVVHPAAASGLLDRLAWYVVARSGSPRRMLWLVCGAAGLLSALFVNDTICLIMTPVLLAAARSTGLPAEPYLLALATSSNVGSVMTITGNPQNMLIGQTSGWSWAPFAVRMAPIGIVCLAINALVVDLLYRKQLRGGGNALLQPSGWGTRRSPGDEAPRMMPRNRRLALKTIAVLAAMLIAFVCGAPMDLSALTAAVAILVLINRPPAETFAAVDWALLLFFGGLFVVVEGVTKTQGIWVARALPMFTHHAGRIGELSAFSALSVAGSNLFSNVPFVMLLRGWIVHLPHASLLWLMLAASTTLAGNLTLVGSVANLIVAQRARDECPLGFWSFLRVGALTTTLTVAGSVVMLWFYGLAGWA